MAPESDLREQFVNTTTHLISAVQISPVTGAVGGSPIKPGQRVWLSKREQELTAQAPALDEDNVLANGKLVRVTEEDGSGAQRPLSYDHGLAQRKAALDAELPPPDLDQSPVGGEDKTPEAPAPGAAASERATMSPPPALVNPPVPPHAPVSPPQPELATTTQPTGTTQAPRPVAPASAAGTQAAGEEVATPAAAAKAADAQNAAAHQAAQREQAQAKANATPQLDPSTGPGEGKGGQEASKKAPGADG